MQGRGALCLAVACLVLLSACHALPPAADKSDNATVATNNNTSANNSTKEDNKGLYNTVVSVAMLVVGPVECLYGYRLRTVTLVFVGMVAGYYAIHLLFLALRDRGIDASLERQVVHLVLATATGAALALLALKIVKVGVVMGGVLAGALVAFWLRGLFVSVGIPDWGFSVCLVGLVLVGVFVGLRLFKWGIIAATAILGAFCFWKAVDALTINDWTEWNILHLRFSDPDISLGYFGAWVLTSLLGAFVQARGSLWRRTRRSVVKANTPSAAAVPN